MLAVTFGWAFLLAAPTGLDVAWTAPADCPAQQDVEADIGALVGQPLAELAEGRVEGRVDQTSAGYRLELDYPGPQGSERRELEAADCETLGRAAALMVAVALDPVATSQVVSPLLERESEPAPSIELDPPTPQTPAPEPGERDADRDAAVVDPTPAPYEPRDRDLRGHTLGLGVSLGGGWGLAPAGTGGVEGEVAWLWRSVQVSAAGHHWFSRTDSLRPGVSVAAAVSGAAVRGCLAPAASRVEVPMCAVVDVGALHGGGRGENVAGRRDADLFVGVGAGLGANWALRPRFALRTRIDVVVAVRRPGFHLTQAGEDNEAYRMPSISVRLLLGPQLRLFGSALFARK